MKTIPTEAGALFASKLKAGKYIPNNSDSFGTSRTQQDLDVTADQLGEEIEKKTDVSAKAGTQSENCQSSLGIHSSDDAD